jgi:hypothetical protein
MIGSDTPCNKTCRGEFCGYHLQSVRRGSLGPLPCLSCGVGVRGKSQLCLRCGGKRYRELKRYYDKRAVHASDEDASDTVNNKIIKTPQDYIERFIIKTNNKLNDDVTI